MGGSTDKLPSIGGGQDQGTAGYFDTILVHACMYVCMYVARVLIIVYLNPAGGKYFTNADIYGTPSDDDRNALQLGPAKTQTMKLNRREGKKVISHYFAIKSSLLILVEKVVTTRNTCKVIYYYHILHTIPHYYQATTAT